VYCYVPEADAASYVVGADPEEAAEPAEADDEAAFSPRCS